MSYARLNTANRTGWPVMGSYGPLSTRNTQGWPVLGRYATRPAGLRGLGQDDFVGPTYEMAHPPEEEQSWWDFLGMLQDGNADLIALEDEFRRNPALLDGRRLIALRNEYTNLASQFQYYYTLLFGSPAPGLGVLPLAVIGGAAVAIALFSAIGAWYMSELNEREKLAQARQLQEALLASADEDDRAADAADARGDVASATAYRNAANQKRQQAGVPSGPKDFSQWFQDNWQWVAVGAAAVLTLPKLVEKI